jgi:glutamate decarboxylase
MIDVKPQPAAKHSKTPEVSFESLQKIFTVPESSQSTLGKIEAEISNNLMGFLKQHIVSSPISPKELDQDFLTTTIDENPIFVSEQAQFLMEKVVSRSVHTSSPNFIGHMTSAIPYFMLPLGKLMLALNQNLVKIETSKAFTPLERQVIGMLHRLVFKNSEDFYAEMTQNHEYSIGAFCSDGTIANLTCLWVALNRLFPPHGDFAGIGNEGIFAAITRYKKTGLAILVSERGHYSLAKSANLLGIGKANLISIPTDEEHKISLPALTDKVAELKQQNIGIVAIVGVAGTTETGNVDPLDNLADLCERENIHFHVDAAWGGPTLFSDSHKHLLKGIERADSVIVDAHKQLYVPVGAGFALFKSQHSLGLVKHHAEYIIRKGSHDLGKTTLEGSRPGMAMLVHSALKIIGRRGFELLIDLGIDKAKRFAKMIEGEPDFELITRPELNLLTYRYVPEVLKPDLRADAATRQRTLELLNRLTIRIQKEQRESGQTFVSRTALKLAKYDAQRVLVFRVVLANPLTTDEILREVLREQRALGQRIFAELSTDASSVIDED